ncbi:MAG: DUF2085 domain-containing protein [Balneolaceae bacterium]
MQHRKLYIVVSFALLAVVLFSLGEILWGGSESRHWTEWMFYGICHQIPDRTYSLGGYYMAVNTRCFGIFLGLWLGWFTIPWINRKTIGKRWPIWILTVAVILQIIDYSGNMFDVWENTNHSRAVLGLMLGISVPIAISDLFVRTNN